MIIWYPLAGRVSKVEKDILSRLERFCNLDLEYSENLSEFMILSFLPIFTVTRLTNIGNIRL